MSDERGLRQEQALERFWDRLVRGEPASAADLDPGIAAFARRVHALDAQPAPDPAYRRQLWEDLMNAPSSADTMTLPAPVPFGPNGRIIPGRRGLARPAASDSRWQRTHVYIATAALLVAVLALIFFYVNDNQQATPPPGPASPTAIPAGTTESWPMYGGNSGRTRSLAGTGPVGEPVALWTYAAAGSDDPRAVVDRGAVGDAALFLPTNDGSIVALDRATGAVLWRAEGYWDTAVIEGDGLIVHAAGTGANGTLARIRQLDGSLVWTAEESSIAGNWNPVVADGVGYTPSGSDFIAFDPATGEVIWRTPLQAPASRGASVANGLAALGDERGTIYGIATADGSITWTFATDAATIGHPVIGNGVAYFTLIGGAEEAYLALDAATGTERWRYVIPGGLGFNNGALGESMIYVPGQDGTIYALDLETGTPVWAFSSGSLPANSPTLVDGVLYLTAGSGFVIAVDAATGAELWRFQLDAGGNGNLPVVDGVVYVGTEGNTVYAIGGSESAGVTPPPVASPAASPESEATAETSPVTFRWASRGGEETLSTPLAVAVAPDGTIWVADIPGQFLIFDEDGNYLETWGTAGDGPGEFNFNGNYIAAYIAFAPDGSFYVSDMNNRRVQRFGKDRTLLGEITGDGTEAGRFGAPNGIAVLPDGTLYISDDQHNEILHFTADGTFIDRFDASGTTDGPLVSPVGIAIDSQGRLVVSEIALGRARVFDQDGNQLAVLDATGLEPPFFNNSAWLGVDSYDNIYICDQNNGLIRVFGPDLEFAFQFGRTGAGEEVMAAPGWIGFGPDGEIYVTDDVGVLRRFDLAEAYRIGAIATPAP